MAEIDLYKFRGFQTYQRELPDAPETPLYGIVFALMGQKDTYSGLLRCRHYEGDDYTNGDWPRVYNYNTTFTNKPLDFVGDDEIDLSIPGWGLAFDNVGLSVGDGFSIGFKATIDSVYYTGKRPVFAGFSVGFGYIGSDLQLMVGTTYNEKVFPQLSDAIYSASYFNQGTEYYYQLSYWSATNIAKIYVNGVEVLSQEVSAISELSGFQLLAYYHELIAWTVTKLLSGVVVSSDPDLMMYTTEYNGVKLNDLTEYPKLVVPSITTHPQSEEVLTGAPFAELTVVALGYGEVPTYQWYSYSGSTWSEIEGEETDAYTPTAAGTYRCVVSNSKGSVNSNSAVLTETEEIDYMEYATNGAAQAAYVVFRGYRKLIPASRASGAVTDYQMHLFVGKSASATGEDIHCEDHCLDTFADLRFTASDRTPLSYWIESVTGSGSSALASVWIKLDSIGTTDTDFYMEYGAETVSASDIEDTFIFGDEFSGSSIDTDKWDTGTVTVSEGEVTGIISSKSTFGSNVAVHAKVKTSATNNYLIGFANVTSYLTYNSFRKYGTDNTFRGETYPPYSLTGSFGTADNNYHIIDMGRDTNVYYSLDYVYKGYIGDPDGDLNISVFQPGNYWDYVAIRKFYATGPIWGEFGEEGRGDAVVYSESTIKTQGSYSLKVVATTYDLNTAIVHTFTPPLDMTGIDYANFNIRSSRTGSNIKLGLHDSGGTTTEVTPNITDADEWQNVGIDLSGVADANKDAIDSLIITIVNADAANTFYLDDFEVGAIAVAPTITTQPQSETVFTGQSFSELTVVASSNGNGTITYQWQSYSGSTWSDIEGETTDSYTPSVAGTYRCQVSNDVDTTNSSSAVLAETEEIDYMEYATNGAAQSAYVTSDSDYLQSYSEGTIKTQGSYSLKGVATTDAVSEDENTKSLLNFNDTDESTTFTDDTGKTWTAHSNAQIDTSDKKFGTGSGLFASATSDYIDTPDSDDFNIASSDGTIEFWIKRSSKDTVQWICGQLTSSTTNAMHTLRFLDTNEVRYWSDCTDGYVAFNSSTTITDTDTWHHIAVVKYGNTVTMYIDGTSVGSEDITGKTFINGGTAFAIGRAGEVSTFTLNARVDGFRFSDTAKYTSNFTPSTSEFVLNSYATLTKTFSTPLNLTDIDYANFNLRSSRTGENIKLGLHDTGGTTTEITPNITSANEWQNVEWDLSGVSDANKNAVDTLTITIVNADSANTFYIDAFEVGEGDGVAEGDILFGTHFDDEDDWNTSQNASLLNDWDQVSAQNRGGDYEVGYIAQNGEAIGKCFKQLWDTTSGTGAQDCWLIKNSIAIPDEFWLGYRFKVDTNWDWGSVDHFKIMKLHFDNGVTWDIGWHSSDYGMTSPYTPPGGGLAIGTDAYGDNWFCSWGDIDDGDWHTFVWHFKHSTGVLELFVDGVDAALTSKSTAYVGTGWDDGSESGYAISFGGNIENGGGGVSEMWDKYDDICIGTTRAKVEEFLGI